MAWYTGFRAVASLARMSAVEAALEALPGTGVEISGETMQIYHDRTDITHLQARRIARTTYDRLGEIAVVRVYDGSGVMHAEASAFGVQ